MWRWPANLTRHGSRTRAAGVNLDFAPMLDLATNPASPVTSGRSFGPHPRKVAEMGAAVIRGLAAEGVLACAKHFPATGDALVDPHLDLPLFDGTADRLAQNELVLFAAAITADVDRRDGSHPTYNSIPIGPLRFLHEYWRDSSPPTEVRWRRPSGRSRHGRNRQTLRPRRKRDRNLRRRRRRHALPRQQHSSLQQSKPSPMQSKQAASSRNNGPRVESGSPGCANGFAPLPGPYRRWTLWVAPSIARSRRRFARAWLRCGSRAAR